MSEKKDVLTAAQLNFAVVDFVNGEKEAIAAAHTYDLVEALKNAYLAGFEDAARLVEDDTDISVALD